MLVSKSLDGIKSSKRRPKIAMVLAGDTVMKLGFLKIPE